MNIDVYVDKNKSLINFMENDHCCKKILFISLNNQFFILTRKDNVTLVLYCLHIIC